MHFLVKIVLCILTFTTAAAIGEPRTCSIEWSSIGWSTFKKIKCSNITFLSTLENDNCYHYVELSINNSSIISLNENTIPRKKTCDLSHLKLTHTQIETITDDAFIKFPKIIKLTLDFNNITNLEFLGYLVELAVLNMQYNKLTQIKAKDFRHLRKLEIINIAHNNVTTIGNLSYNLESLKELYLNNNNIVEIGDVFRKLQLLRILNLSHNKIKLIKEGTFSGLNNLNLNLSGCDISFIEPHSFEIDRFENLDLSNNKLGSFENNCLRTRFIGDFLLQNNPINLSSNSTILNSIDGIYSLDLSACSENVTILQADFLIVNNLRDLKLTATRISSIHPQAFTHCISLHNLDLSSNKIQTINSFTFFPLVNLQTLDLSNNPILIEGFEHAFSNLKSLNSFRISGINWVVEDYHFAGLTNLIYLQFVDSRDLQLKSKCFSRLNNLQSLKFTNTTIKSIDTEAFSGMRILPESNLCQNRVQTEYSLNLCNVSLRSVAASAFSGSQTSIRNINLNNNNIEKIETNTFRGFRSLKLIKLENANISSIDSFAFSNLSFNKINYVESSNNTGIYLSFNNINKISFDSFSNIGDLNILDLSFSNIKHVEPFSFNNLAFCYLEECSNIIYLNHNDIYSITNQTFTKISHIKVIDLSYNKINHLDSNIFSSIQFYFDAEYKRHKSAIYLNNNFLTTIDPEMFLPLTNLTKLDLSCNNITVIEDNTFSSLRNLSWLSLANNKLFRLSSESFAGLNNLNDLSLSENVIEDFPLGTFKNFPMLRNLELGHNRLSRFKLGSFSNLRNLDSLNLSHNNFVTLDDTTFYTLHNLNLLNLNNNVLNVINYTSLLDHLFKLSYISINDNNWNCKFLLNMLKAFKNRNVQYLYNATRKFTGENIDGISCSELEENVEEYTTVSSKQFKTDKYSNKLDFGVNLFPYYNNKINKFTNQQWNTTKNDTYLSQGVLKGIFNNSNKLLSAVYDLINVTKHKQPESGKEPKNDIINKLMENENEGIEITKENTKEMLKLLSKITNEVRNLNSSNSNFSVYMLLLTSIGMLCLIGYNTYKKYFYKNKCSINANQSSEMILIDAN